MRRLIVFVSILAMLGAVGACGGDETPGSSPTADTDLEQDSGPSLDAGSDAEPDASSFPDDISYESYVETVVRFQLVDLICTRAWACQAPPKKDVSALGRRFESIEACRSGLKDSNRYQTRVREQLQPTKRLIEAGRVDYDSQRAADCLDQIASLTVAQKCGPNPTAFLEACNAFPPITGAIGPGGACIDHAECADGYCPTGQSCTGACTTVNGCGAGPACSDDKYCADQPDGTSSCEMRKPQGEVCDGSDECQEGLYCPLSSGRKTCQTRKSYRSACINEDECVNALTCIEDPDTGNEVCATPKSDGDVCRGRDECAGELVCMRLESKSEGICTGVGDRQRGESCARNDNCSPGNACIDETCVKLEYVSEGAACTDQTRCPPGTICQLASPGAATGICNPPAQSGDTCLDSTYCTYGLYCDGATNSQPGSCAPAKDDGAGCEHNNDCTSGLCRDSLCGAPAEVCPIP